jgi:hypothetical protein
MQVEIVLHKRFENTGDTNETHMNGLTQFRVPSLWLVQKVPIDANGNFF